MNFRENLKKIVGIHVGAIFKEILGKKLKKLKSRKILNSILKKCKQKKF